MCQSDFFIYFFYLYFAKIYGPPKNLLNYTSAVVGHGGRDPTAVRHGSRGRGPPARAHTVVGHCVRSLLPCRQAAAWPLGSTAGHGGMYGPTVVRCGGRIFLVNFNF
jgi:hypothetical protein